MFNLFQRSRIVGKFPQQSLHLQIFRIPLFQSNVMEDVHHDGIGIIHQFFFVDDEYSMGIFQLHPVHVVERLRVKGLGQIVATAIPRFAQFVEALPGDDDGHAGRFLQYILEVRRIDVPRRLIDHLVRLAASILAMQFVEQVGSLSQYSIHIQKVGRSFHHVHVLVGQSVIDVGGVGGGRIPAEPRIGILNVLWRPGDEVSGLEGAHDAWSVEEEGTHEGGSGMFESGDYGTQSMMMICCC